MLVALYFFFFFFNDTATTEIYTLSLHDALPILFRRTFSACSSTDKSSSSNAHAIFVARPGFTFAKTSKADRKSTRLNSSHGYISYAVFCLKKKKNDLERFPRRTVFNRVN